MKYIIKSGAYLICNVLIECIENDEVVLNGKFNPLNDYHIVKEIIKKYSDLILKFNIIEIEKNIQFKELKKNIDNFGFTAYKENGEKVNFSVIELRDYSDQLGDEGYEIYIYR